MKLDLTHKVAVVSGSTSGIGLGIAKGLAWAGATV
ncbi:oxidoreductase, partial [Klebsiella pneumoniae]|nr:oxidoreductase [Klebsiella pneumoniae]